VDAAATGTATGSGTGPAADEAAPAAATEQGQSGQFPVAWLVVLALAALVGAVAGTRLAARSRAGERRPR
jgi:hypothetical protein